VEKERQESLPLLHWLPAFDLETTQRLDGCFDESAPGVWQEKSRGGHRLYDFSGGGRRVQSDLEIRGFCENGSPSFFDLPVDVRRQSFDPPSPNHDDIQ